MQFLHWSRLRLGYVVSATGYRRDSPSPARWGPILSHAVSAASATHSVQLPSVVGTPTHLTATPPRPARLPLTCEHRTCAPRPLHRALLRGTRVCKYELSPRSQATGAARDCVKTMLLLHVRSNMMGFPTLFPHQRLQNVPSQSVFVGACTIPPSFDTVWRST